MANLNEMKIYRSIRRNRLTQPFGENQACGKVDSAGVIERPFIVRSKVNGTCPAGFVEFYTAIGMKGHSGYDWEAPRGEQVYFDTILPGVRWWGQIEWDDAQGMNLDVYTVDPVFVPTLPPDVSWHVRQVWTETKGYLYLKRRFTHGYKAFLEDKPLVQVGTFSDGRPQMKPEIKPGDLIMLADNTGASAGDHLHTATKFTAKNSMTIGVDNGFQGAFNTDQWFTNEFILDVLAGDKPPLSTAERLESLARSYELQGKHKEAGWIRAIKEVVIAFGG